LRLFRGEEEAAESAGDPIPAFAESNPPTSFSRRLFAIRARRRRRPARHRGDGRRATTTRGARRPGSAIVTRSL